MALHGRGRARVTTGHRGLLSPLTTDSPLVRQGAIVIISSPRASSLQVCRRSKKTRRDRLIRLAQAHPDGLLGCADEVWWSRVARPALQAWQDDDHPLRLVEQTVARDDPDPKAWPVMAS